MADALVQRGPDAGAVWSGAPGVALAHRRLSIVDLSPAGAQPMTSASGRLVLTYNGEIYNVPELRARLPHVRWRGHSDTEVLLEAIGAWGIREALRRAHGMFALALWDFETRSLVLARDRAGEKPLYYGCVDSAFVFASELKALRVMPGWRGEIDRKAVSLYMQHGYVPAPHSIYRGIRKLPPGSMLTVGEASTWADPIPVNYWSLGEAIADARNRPVTSECQAVDELEALLKDAVGRQMVSDVPVGAFLSGGVDSSTVVALMQARGGPAVNTFTIGFSEPAYDESKFARDVAAHLGTHHTEMIVSPSQAIEVIPDLPTIYDEPFADSSQIPTVLVSRLAHQHVSVALSGDAGDELFGGYTRYRLASRLDSSLGWLPIKLRAIASRSIQSVSPSDWQRVYARGSILFPERLKNWPFGDRMHKLAGLLGTRNLESLYRKLILHWTASTVCNSDADELDLPMWDSELDASRTEWMMRADFATYLPDDILTKVDRAAMSTSLETRVPLLDPRVIEFAWSLPLRFKSRGGVGKRVLRSVLARYVPRALFERPKVGFGIPLDVWLRGPLREWAEDLISLQALKEGDLLRPELIRSRWAEHLSGQRNWQYQLWDVLMLQAWHRQNASHSPVDGSTPGWS